MIFVSLYNSFIQTLILILSLTLAIFGTFLGLLITGKSLDLVAKKSILQIDFANQKKNWGFSRQEALRFVECGF